MVKANNRYISSKKLYACDKCLSVTFAFTHAWNTVYFFNPHCLTLNDKKFQTRNKE